MLIILPSSETKLDPPARGKTLDVAALGFPGLHETRERLLDALVETSAGAEALERLQVGPGLAEEVARNTAIRALKTRPAIELYTGVVHDALDAATLTPEARRRMTKHAVVASGLFGLLRPADRIPPYRLDIASRLQGAERLEAAWKPVLPAALDEAAETVGITERRGVIVDLRAQSYQALGRPARSGARLVAIQVDVDLTSGRRAPSYGAKQVRGLVGRFLLESGAKPKDPAALAALIGERWAHRLEAPAKKGQPWVLTVVPEA